ncbi:MAG TPA: hypothetical protein VNU28_04145 [Solirubrobacteraceae bacterium]|jgi:hypothetical protein|nr:hypothetical protein [Solirubrobacteraceae bacterium]
MIAATHPTKRRFPSPGNSRRRQAALLAVLAVLAVLALALTSCGSTTSAQSAAVVNPPAPPQCAEAVARALGTIAEHVYHELSGGRIALPAAERVASSPALLAAIQAKDPAAAKKALGPLLRGQLVRLHVSVAGRTFVEYGSANGIAPVSTPLKDVEGRTIGTVTAAEEGVFGYAGTLYAITEAQVFARSGGRSLGGSSSPGPSAIPDKGEISYKGRRYAVYSFPGAGFPQKKLRVFVLAPVPPGSTCASTPAETATNAIGETAKRIYREEQSGAATRAVVRDFENSRPFQEAVARDNPTATRAAIVKFFEGTLHVVRVRATLGEKLVADVGGPHVLAPIRGDVRNAHGGVVGHFLLSVQDDLGYVILAQRFTGVQVFLYERKLLLLGSASPAPLSIPRQGEVLLDGTRYHAYSFTAEAFPKGSLEVSLLIPPVPGT